MDSASLPVSRFEENKPFLSSPAPHLETNPREVHSYLNTFPLNESLAFVYSSCTQGFVFWTHEMPGELGKLPSRYWEAGPVVRRDETPCQSPFQLRKTCPKRSALSGSQTLGLRVLSFSWSVGFLQGIPRMDLPAQNDLETTHCTDFMSPTA